MTFTDLLLLGLAGFSAAWLTITIGMLADTITERRARKRDRGRP